MEAVAGAGAVVRSGPFQPAAEAVLRREPRAAMWAGRSRVCVRPRGSSGGFVDDGHLRYYAPLARCGGRKEEEKRAVKRRAKLLEGLAAFQAMEGGLGVATARWEIQEGKMSIMEAADILLARLELLRAEEKEMKRKKKEEKAAMRAGAKQMKGCDESEDSEEEGDMKKVKMEEMDSMKTAANQITDCNGCKDSKDKAMKRKKKQEKAACKQKNDCGESEDSSSSSSSESSDSDCEEEVIDMGSLRTVPADAEPATGIVQTTVPADTEPATGIVQTEMLKGELGSPIMVNGVEERTKDFNALKYDPECGDTVAFDVGSSANICCSSKKTEEASANALKCDSGCSSSIGSCVGSSSSTCCSSSSKSSSSVVMVTEAASPMERIEICMGGKCKKSGAMELMQEFQRRVGIEGAVVGCKCMGKCRQGPNVRVRNMYQEGDESVMAVKTPLCIGVGLDDVGKIVGNFFAEKKDMGLLAV